MRDVEILCNLEDLTLDATTKKYTFDSTTFDIEQPLRCDITDCSVVLSDKKPYVFVCSDELFSRKKVRQNSTKFGSVITMLDSKNVFSFTAPAAASSGGGSSNSGTAPSVDDVTDADIVAFGTDLRMWFDLAPARTLKANFSQASAVGDLFHYMYSRAPSPAVLILDANYDGELVQWKTGVIGLSRDAQGHLASLSDATNPTTTYDSEFHLHHIFKTPVGYNDTFGLFRIGWEHCRLQALANGGLKFINSGDSSVTLTNLIWVPSTNYLLSVSRKLTGAANAAQFHWRLENLDSDTVLTEVTDAGMSYTANQTNYPISIGMVGQYCRHIFGPLLLVNGTDQVQFDTSVNWIKNWFGLSTSGNSNSESSEAASATLNHAYNLEESEKITFKQNCQTLSTLDFTFRDESGAVLEPARGVLRLKFRV